MMSDNQNPSTFERYNLISIGLHWLMFILISAAFSIALILDDLPKSIKPFWTNIHFVLGVLVFIFLLIRLSWRLFIGVPELPESVHSHTKKASQIIHFALYLLMALIPVVGVLTAFYRGRGIDFGFYSIPSPFELNRNVASFYKEFHELAAWVLVVLVLAHAATAFFHHFILKDGILLRMIPNKKS
jgi:superoxide oxidase